MKGNAEVISKFGGVKINGTWFNADSKELAESVAKNWKEYKGKEVELNLISETKFDNIQVTGGTTTSNDFSSKISVRQTAAHAASRMLSHYNPEDFVAAATLIENWINREERE